ncbi:MAG: hypothetical protein JAY75_23070 [Candidatus Thiodiazotropha taylori]|nr:hypothetical protein [Candidatus Thiodiazotropha taylori]MCG8095367.1 hypothetical protein [Candidatus Thiodiazotropha endolucinida]MCG7882921.1 hypothetical protein [Candidatus Thiodiazotropha taylori]MCG7888541.1 hypothetical protein [Candidatus Thiodiazotropha taylori]MCG7892265.1 hypothetical protein [Candidatus Thiodiazotropha taylori]
MDAKKRNLQTAIVFFFIGLIFGHITGTNSAQVPPIDPNNFRIVAEELRQQDDNAKAQILLPDFDGGEVNE